MQQVAERLEGFKRIRTLSAAVIMIACSSVAMGDVYNYGGSIYAGVETSPPIGRDFRLNRLEDNTRTRVYLENYNTPILPFTLYDATSVGRYDSNSDLRPGYIPTGAGVRGNSYLFHFDPTSGVPAKESRGWVEFTHPIYVLSTNPSLDQSDFNYGFAGAAYATGIVADRGFDLNPQDWFDISNPQPGIWRLEFFARASTGMDELRVIEVIPAPASLALLGLGGSIAFRRRRGSCM